MNKEIDIIIPAYNAGHTIDKTLMSIAIQNIVNKVCVIIVDDCSDKEHRELYQKYISQFSPYFRIDYIKLKENSGPGIARQEGFNFGSSKYVTFIDADDVFATSTAIFTLYNEIENNNKLRFCNSIFQEEVRDQNNTFYTYKDHDNDMTWMFGKIYRRSFLETNGIGFNCSRSNEDCGFNTMVMLLSTTDNLKYIDRLTYCWNYNELSITKNNDYSFWGLKGYIYNNIWAIHESNRIINELVSIPNRVISDNANDINTDVTFINIVYHVVNTMTLIYMYYETLIKDNRNQEQLDLYLSWSLDFYRDVYIQYRKDITNEIFVSSYKQIRNLHDYLFENYIESISFMEFLEYLDKQFMNTNNIQRIVNAENDIIGYISINNVTQNEDKDINSNVITVDKFDLFNNNDDRYDFLFNNM